MANECFVPRLPVDREEIQFHDWRISYEKSHILKSSCKLGTAECCPKDAPEVCDLCHYQQSLELPHLPDMVFHKNRLLLKHKNGAVLEFRPMDALALVDNGKQPLEVACAQEWRETRSEQTREEKFKPFDWTFTSTYQGTMNDKVRSESTEQTLNKFKLMQRENIIFYHDLTLFEDELHDHGISVMSVRIRVMPSGFFVLLRHFLRVDNVLIRMHDTRFHHEIENDYILKEYIHREAPCTDLQNSVAFWTNPDEMQSFLPVKTKELHKLFFT
ncbi:TIP41-like protein isoform X2 [Drosophila ficusphila]|uniref:TIP41-like protein isoform X2 n=1 Tax=Drosophila ficusphila TaxID=30025 RepID=UPI0007E68248|nr:TIP41-like protein isoform X2 [Drosophila ficusphila]